MPGLSKEEEQSSKDCRQGNKRTIFAFVDRASNTLNVHLIITFQLRKIGLREAGRRMFLNVPGRDGGAGSGGHAYGDPGGGPDPTCNWVEDKLKEGI